MKQTPAKIFLAEQRGRLATAQFARYCTLPFGEYAAAGRAPVGALFALNEETLAGGQAIALPADRAAWVLVLPITGAVRAGRAAADTALVEVEEAYLLPVAAGGTVHFSNPYPTDAVTWLHLWLVADSSQQPAEQLFSFANKPLANQLTQVVPTGPWPVRASLGRFAGRAEAVYELPEPGACCFAYVLAGAFEVAGRLLHAHDGLALWAAPAVELEALSNDALLLLLALPPAP
ncbi:hypothetical protein GCM10027422_18940 [Hymenobacter arcticus]